MCFRGLLGNAKSIILAVALILLSGCRIQGTVTFDGEPVSGQQILLSGDGISISTLTDKHGNYEFENVSSGYYRVSLVANGSTSLWVHKPTNNGSINNIDFNVDSFTQRETSSGSVIGQEDENGTLVWRGIPYAEAPIGPLRWKAARPYVETSNEDYLAIKFSNACPQLSHLLIDTPITMLGEIVGQEDCLYLNLWSPNFETLPQGDEARPVMVWIHGGGNTAGESSIFDGKVLAEKYGVIVVTINYRLGVFGFFSHPAIQSNSETLLDQGANFALTDQIQALKWVQQNISVFGGDPNRVMIFGESAGAANVGALLASPQASGLFHRAVMQSSGFGWNTQYSAEACTNEGGHQASSHEIAKALVIADGLAGSSEDADEYLSDIDMNELNDYLLSKSPEEILTHFDGSRFGMYPYPTLIRDGITLPDSNPYELFRSGNYNQVPIISGTNRDEPKIFMAFDPEYVLGGLPVFAPDMNYFELAAYYSSSVWRANAVDEFAAAISQHQDNFYAYRFDWDEEPKILWTDLSTLIGAAHFFEIPFVFGTPDIFPVKIGTPFLFTNSSKEGRKALAGSMSSYWASFAYTGDPGLGMLQEQSTEWQPWTNDPSSPNFIVFDSKADGGIKMIHTQIARQEIQEELQAETGFSNLEQKCETYDRNFGRDQWYSLNCL
ncbi:MAG: carboxylesterase family protein [Pseudomonadales bacterium]|nr:carboxylesterase family protein [Pseudomonadales bacterium]